MKKLQKVVSNDLSSITVNYETYDSIGIWVYNSIKFEKEDRANQFIEQVQKDFTKRLISVEKRTIIYEKFTNSE